MSKDAELDDGGPDVVEKTDSKGHKYRVKIHEPQEPVPVDQQQPGETAAQHRGRWAAHARKAKAEEEKERKGGNGPAVWLADAIGRKVEVYCHRSPKVRGVVVKVDLRFGKVMIGGDGQDDDVEISMSEIAQVRYPK